MRKMLRRRELFPAVKAGLKPVFFDQLNDALEAHDAEEYGRIAGAERCSPVTMIRRKRNPANKCIL